jgi:hypothetical protein
MRYASIKEAEADRFALVRALDRKLVLVNCWLVLLDAAIAEQSKYPEIDAWIAFRKKYERVLGVWRLKHGFAVQQNGNPTSNLQ